MKRTRSLRWPRLQEPAVSALAAVRRGGPYGLRVDVRSDDPHGNPHPVEPRQALGWASVARPDGGTLVLLLADLPRRMRFVGDPDTVDLVSDDFGGAWFGGALDGDPVVAFGLVDLNGPEATPAVWYLADPPPEVVTTIVDIPHLVAVVPADAPGTEDFGRDPERTIALLTHATVVEVFHSPRSLLAFASPRENAQPTDHHEAVDLERPDALRVALAPVRSRVARSTGEMLTDDQLVPMAWRPWHYDLIDAEHVSGLLWQWPIIQTYFELKNPASLDIEGVSAPSSAQQGKLRSYLSVVERLARSMGVNSGGSVKWTLTRELGSGAVEVDAPHDDALAALLPNLRQLFDPDEGSRLSFTHMLKAFSGAAHSAGLTDLTAELRVWRRAHAQLRRTHVDALRHELAEEAAGEALGRPHRGASSRIPDIPSEKLITTFMYGETLHRDEDKARQIADWDEDPLLGPLMRQEVRADAQAFVHFYGGFAGYIARWLALTTCNN